MKNISIAIAALMVAGFPTLVSAQGYWGGTYGRAEPPPDAASPYGGRSDDGRADGGYDDRDPDANDAADDDRYPSSADRGSDSDRYFDRRDGGRGYSDRRDDDEQTYGGREGDDRDFANRPEWGRPDVRRPDDGRFDDERYDDRRYDDRRSDDRPSGNHRFENSRLDDPGDYGQWDAAPSRDEEERLSKTPGSEGGTRPYIQPVAPPKVAFSGAYAPGSIVIDTGARKLYYVLSSTSAYAYPIGVGRQGFTWTGKEKVSRLSDWPDWYPPADMRKRKPGLPERMLGGIRNPLGAKAIYLGNTLYRIHGTNDPKSIGKAESSGCFRMMNENVLHLASLVQVGTEVTVVRSLNGAVASRAKTPKSRVSERPSQPRADAREHYEYAPYSSSADDLR